MVFKKHRGRKKKISATTPFLVQLFKDYIKDWKDYQGLVVCTPKKALGYTRLLISSRTVGFFDRIWIVSGVLEYVNKESMGSLEAELYRKLKPLECNIVRRGFIRKNWFFTSSPYLEKMRSLIPEFKASSNLVDKLNQNTEIMSLIRSVKPDKFSISLLSLPIEYQPFARDENAAVKGMVEFYKSPENITWVITLEGMFNRWIGIEKKGHEVMDLMRKVCKVVLNETELIRKNLNTSS
ncbi:MAG: hypothetical protein QXL27_08295 [Candidatus Bathyarchaeia archaeon]